MYGSSYDRRRYFDDEEAGISYDGNPGSPKDGYELSPPRSFVGWDLFGTCQMVRGRLLTLTLDDGGQLFTQIGRLESVAYGCASRLTLRLTAWNDGQIEDVKIGRVVIRWT